MTGKQVEVQMGRQAESVQVGWEAGEGRRGQAGQAWVRAGASRQACRQAGRWVGSRAGGRTGGREAGRRANRQVDKQRNRQKEEKYLLIKYV